MAVYDFPPSNTFDQDSFWDFLGDLASRVGRQLMEKALVAYYVAIDPQTPNWARAELFGALVYLGFPIDAVPDYLPVVGYSDDMALLAMALVAVAANIRWSHVRRARSAMRSWGFKVEDPDSSYGDDDPALGFNDD
jgi:uncharacterized membrane protein YkvA (DUF1232 family)